MNNVKLPIGESDFRTIREEGLFYIDKSALIEELYNNRGICALAFTRPRRFGKTLAMSMLSSFFDIREDSRALFDGLYISSNKEVCDEWMNKFPTVFVSFKDVDGLDFESAVQTFSFTMMRLYDRYCFLEESDKISEWDKISFKDIHSDKASYFDLMNSLSLLLRLLYEHYGKKVILLIDEYDVPLAKAGENGYYPEMLDLITGIFSVLKDNEYLEMGVLTGCLRIRNESIISGVNNLYYNMVTSTRFSSYFGFTSLEVENTFKELGEEDKLPLVKEWYGGYRFGKSEVYSPWDVILYLNDLKHNSLAQPKNYWANTSGNAIIAALVRRGSISVFNSIDALLSGEFIVKTIDECVSHDYLNSIAYNLWSILLMTGYLTTGNSDDVGMKLDEDEKALRIPNKEVMSIFSSSLASWFCQETRKDDLSALEDALWNGESEKLGVEMTRILNKTISYYNPYNECIYCLFFDGVFKGLGYYTEAKAEYSMGRPDFIVSDNCRKRVAIFEVKGIKDTANKADLQIEKMKYKDVFTYFKTIIIYSVVFDDEGVRVVLKDRIER